MGCMMNFRGVFAIPCTPFTEGGAVDEASLRREVRFCLECGAHGLVAPVNASEVYTLADDERKRVVSLVAEENAGRVPFVAGCSALSAPHAVMLARQAREAGADGIIAMPPLVRKASEAEIHEYYRAISDAAGLPIVLQDFIAPIGTPMAAELMARMVREIPQVNFVKEETALGPHVMSRLRELCGENLRGLMGGQGGRYLFNEWARGACGTMPACHLADVQVDLWNLLEAGREREARDVFNGMLPLLNFEHMYAVAAYKEVLYRRGVIATTVCRGGPGALDDVDRRELDAILAAIEPLLRVRPSAARP
jgi:dihydrodipicolinate synthase/N-acetylneuraminate lyase